MRPWKREQLGGGYDFSLWIEENRAGDGRRGHRGFKRDQSRYPAPLPGRPGRHSRSSITGSISTNTAKVNPTDALKDYGIDAKQAVSSVRRTDHPPEGDRSSRPRHPIHGSGFSDCSLCQGAGHAGNCGRNEAAVEQARAKRPDIIWIEEMVDREAVIELYSHAAVFCCPSIYEPFGIINLEAMACETAVVASAVGGIKEVVVDGETGFLVPLEQMKESPFEPINPKNSRATSRRKSISSWPSRSCEKNSAKPAENARKKNSAGRRSLEKQRSSTNHWSRLASDNAGEGRARPVCHPERREGPHAPPCWITHSHPLMLDRSSCRDLIRMSNAECALSPSLPIVGWAVNRRTNVGARSKGRDELVHPLDKVWFCLCWFRFSNRSPVFYSNRAAPATARYTDRGRQNS